MGGGFIHALASGAWLTGERVRAVALISAAIGLAMLVFMWTTADGTVDRFGQPLGSDFTAFWNAGRIATDGEAAEAWNHGVLNREVEATHGVAYATGWLYPPIFLLVAAALAYLPYLAALLVWQGFSLAVWAATLWAVLRRWTAWWIALACPIAPLVLANGQNSFLTASLLGAGLVQFARRPWLAGAAFGALIYKPQLGLLILPLLLMTRNWRATAGAAVSASLLIGLTVLLWGIDAWQAFAGSLELGRAYMEQGAVGFHKSASVFSAARQAGAPLALAYGVQALGTAAALFIVWRLRAADGQVLAAGVCAAIALSTPYFLDYDLAIAVLGAAFLVAHAYRAGFLPYEKAVVAAIWIAPWFVRPANEHLLLPLGPMVAILLAWISLRRERVRASPSRR